MSKFWLASAFILTLILSACNPEPYGDCNLPRSAAIDETCQPKADDQKEGASSSANCVVDFIFECESRLCGVYQGDSPFCTETCTKEGKGECPLDGCCVEFVPGTGEYYCISDVLARKYRVATCGYGTAGTESPSE